MSRIMVTIKEAIARMNGRIHHSRTVNRVRLRSLPCKVRGCRGDSREMRIDSVSMTAGAAVLVGTKMVPSGEPGIAIRALDGSLFGVLRTNVTRQGALLGEPFVTVWTRKWFLASV
mmetsp:Transcript_2671/g.5078  ORF Transcript_2671/g.5078 Transcript_2671/m.5078 type:complete len:116 (-) Transcript_2671:1758-2105(-)